MQLNEGEADNSEDEVSTGDYDERPADKVSASSAVKTKKKRKKKAKDKSSSSDTKVAVLYSSFGNE